MLNVLVTMRRALKTVMQHTGGVEAERHAAEAFEHNGGIQTACFGVGGSRHLRANYEKHTQAIYLVFGPVGLFEKAKALRAEVQRGRSAGCECSIMMTTFHEALVSRPLWDV